MRLTAQRRLCPAWVVTLFAWLAFVWPHHAAAENRFSVRGNYYREESTRVLAPQVAATVDVPDERVTLGVAYLLDAISSASIASGAAQVTGGDVVFTEIRHEIAPSISSRIGRFNFGGRYRYSTETDYEANNASAFLATDFLQRTATMTLSYAYEFDRVYEIYDVTGRRIAWCGGSFAEVCRGGGRGVGSNLLQIHHFTLAWTHAVHKNVLAAFSAEYANQRGPQDNPYRLAPPNIDETHPVRRNRGVVGGAVFASVPAARMVIEPRYDFYADDWSIEGNSVDLRVHFRPVPHFRFRLRYRFYHQTAAFFFREDGMYGNADAGEECTRASRANCATADPKMASFRSHTPGIQLTWELDSIAKYRGLRWLAGGYLQATYNHMFQTTRYGPARIGSLEFSLPF